MKKREQTPKPCLLEEEKRNKKALPQRWYMKKDITP
jgi:hypothetical protein